MHATCQAFLTPSHSIIQISHKACYYRQQNYIFVQYFYQILRSAFNKNFEKGTNFRLNFQRNLCHLIRVKVNLFLDRMGQVLKVFFLSLLLILCDLFSFLIVTVTDLSACAHKIRRRLHLSAQSGIRPFFPAFFHSPAF
jgi:hypothetical protein